MGTYKSPCIIYKQEHTSCPAPSFSNEPPNTDEKCTTNIGLQASSLISSVTGLVITLQNYNNNLNL